MARTRRRARGRVAKRRSGRRRCRRRPSWPGTDHHEYPLGIGIPLARGTHGVTSQNDVARRTHQRFYRGYRDPGAAGASVRMNTDFSSAHRRLPAPDTLGSFFLSPRTPLMSPPPQSTIEGLGDGIVGSVERPAGSTPIDSDPASRHRRSSPFRRARLVRDEAVARYWEGPPGRSRRCTAAGSSPRFARVRATHGMLALTTRSPVRSPRRVTPLRAHRPRRHRRGWCCG